ncbi:MAG: hypothetical protein ABW075_06750 [Aeromicrobium sp.]
MRSLPSFLGGLVATLAAIVTVPMLWLSVNVRDEDGFAALSNQLAADAELQRSVSAYLAEDFVARGLLPGALQAPAAAAMTLVAGQATNQPEFATAWEASQRSLHQSALEETSGPVTVDLSPIAAFVVDRVGEQLPVALPGDITVPVQIGDEQDRDRLQWVERSRMWSLLGLMVILVSVAVCFLGARSKSLAIAGLGFGALVVAGTLWSATTVVSPMLIDGFEDSTEFAKSLQKLLVDRAADSLATWLTPMAWAGAAATVVGLLGHAVASRRR